MWLKVLSERDSTVCRIQTLEAFPDLSVLHARWPERYPHLLESVADGTAQARFDVLFACAEPGFALGEVSSHPGAVQVAGSFLDALDERWRAERVPADAAVADVPFRGGWFVYLGYELAGEVEPVLRLPDGGRVLPRAFAQRCPAALVRDRLLCRLHLVAEPGYAGRLAEMRRDLEALGENRSAPVAAPVPVGELIEDDPGRYLEGVRRVQRYIREGDVFQVNLSRGWSARVPGAAPADVYRALRASNPGPFAGIASWGDTAIISSSPERLVNVCGAGIQTRPIAGTRPRGTGAGDDADFRRELLAHPKERAEHVMLIDLERNDLGRVCEPGSVEVNELMALESYAHVHHIVSNVRGRLRPGVTPGAVVRAVFPGGTITGCPKVRCMQIIAELECAARDAYTGSMGYLNRDGDLDLNILIRTLVQSGEQLHLRAGAGIVADSIPELELEETRAKARGLLLALAAGQ